MPEADVSRVENEDEDLYGRIYWFERQAELGLPDLFERSRSDLADRCLHWLRILLAYRSPPARVLEIGASHGGFVALLEQAGFRASGLELSRWVASTARETFGVDMLVGPLEDQDIAPGGLDAVVAMDVLEHLPDPLGTMSRCRELLTEDGVVLLQTPCRPTRPPPDRLEAEGHPFSAMLLPEHLHLFQRDSLTSLLRRAGLGEAAFEPAVFGETDMCVVAGRRPLVRRDDEEVREMLLSHAGGRLVAALLDVAATRDQLQESYHQADDDRRERLVQIGELAGLLEDRDRQVSALAGARDGLERDVQRLRGELEKALGAERAAEEKSHHLRRDASRLGRELEAARAASADQQRKLHAQRSETARLAGAVSELELQLEKTHARCDELQRRRDETQEEAGRLKGLLAETSLRLEEHEWAARKDGAEHALLAARHQTLRSLVADLRNSRVYKAMVRAGRWRRLDEIAETATREQGPERRPVRDTDPAGSERWDFPVYDPPRSRGRRSAVAVDLTAILPGAENGGAKLVAVQLVQAMANLQPDRELALLTTDRCHDELADLEGGNVHRRRVDPGLAGSPLVEDEPRCSLLFSPTTAPPFKDPRVPLVSLIHDLQFRTYPEFFPPEELAAREIAFRRAVRWSQRVVTVSDYVRRSVLESSPLAPERVRTIYSATTHRFPDVAEAQAEDVLARYGVRRRKFLLYPANFWPHKNHGMLLTAFGQWCHRHPDSDLRLVLTGADRPDPARVRQAADGMGLDGRVVFPGYVPDADLAALLDGALALVFPSLYEGFGLPVLEAMARGCPVLCSNLTALPEVAGDAALYFDPRKPADIVAALERLTGDPDTAEDLRRRGLRRAAEFGDQERMAGAYLTLFDELLEDGTVFHDTLTGRYPDGWTGRSFVVTHSEPSCSLHLELMNERSDAVTLTATAGPTTHHATLSPQQTLSLVCRLPARPGHLTFRVTPTFCPAELHGTDDTRHLGVRLSSCRLSGTSEVDLTAEPADA